MILNFRDPYLKTITQYNVEIVYNPTSSQMFANLLEKLDVITIFDQE